MPRAVKDMWHPLHVFRHKTVTLNHVKKYFGRLLWRHPAAGRAIPPPREWRTALRAPGMETEPTGIFYYPADAVHKLHAFAIGPQGEAVSRVGHVRVQISHDLDPQNSLGVVQAGSAAKAGNAGAAEVPQSTLATIGMWSTGPGMKVSRNLVAGVHSGFVVTLELHGVGYRAEEERDKNRIGLRLGFSNTLYVPIERADGVKYRVVEPQVVQVYGCNLEKVHGAAAALRAMRKPEPYKGKGVRYRNEYVKLKAAKKTK
ncbi:50S ribosomal protein L6 [Porphyridium purpureum]|uniref:50S ribosomal protein L6 n=1 Tax=Porphyridium purpureum TaxID=35688 RepID=A0A5J4YV69_PORPP|nr:50S ribosomal protein L6 [Porphyridium purpureum]|eukprot:POR8436..scf227_4